MSGVTRKDSAPHRIQYRVRTRAACQEIGDGVFTFVCKGQCVVGAFGVGSASYPMLFGSGIYKARIPSGSKLGQRADAPTSPTAYLATTNQKRFQVQALSGSKTRLLWTLRTNDPVRPSKLPVSDADRYSH